MMNSALLNGNMDVATALAKAEQSNGTHIAKQLKDARQMRQIAEKSEEFEAVFIAEMMKPMFEGISTEAPFGGGKGEEIFRGMLLQEYGKSLAKSGGLGIAASVQQELIRIQSQQQPQTQTQE